MKTRFPKLQGFLIKPSKTQPERKDPGKEKKPKLNVSTAFVYNGHIVATDGKILLIFNLKEYMKHFVTMDDGEKPATAYGIISNIVEKLEGKTLSREFFSIFSKMQRIVKIDDSKIYVDLNGFHSEYTIEEGYDYELLQSFLSKQKIVWNIQRSDQGQFGIGGSTLSNITSVISTEMQNDSLVFERTSDDRAKFCLTNKDFIFGICAFSTEAESSITKFGEANDFFELHV